MNLPIGFQQSKEKDLDAYVRECDGLGGPSNPACIEYMSDFSCSVDSSNASRLAPLSNEYVDFQIQLYQTISGRNVDQTINEMTDFDLQHHAKGSNPYTDISPSDAAMHLIRLLKMFRASSIPRGGHVLDMGAGWGLSSEICAYIGCKVTAVDINQRFVDLINTRAAASRLPIRAVQGTFDEYEMTDSFDLIAFYECLHHAIRPWTVIERCASKLMTDGKIALAGEPINTAWWPHWGIRLDALSIYCIRKFGWFESGWSEAFICECLTMAKLKPKVVYDIDPLIGSVIVASR